MLLTALALVVLRLQGISAQVVFSQPVAGQEISGDTSFLVSCSDSSSAPHFDQMSNFSMILFAGSYESPTLLYAWDLGITMPSAAINSITINSSLGPSADEYFLGMSGWLSTQSSDGTISITYLSPMFTLRNMSGASSLIPSPTATTASPSATSLPGRFVLCKDSDGNVTIGEDGLGNVVNSACETAALSAIDVSTSTTSTILTQTSASFVTTTPSALPEFPAQLAVTSPTITQSAAAGSTSQSTSSLAASSSNSTTTSKRGVRVAFFLIIAAMILLTIIALFWIWRRYKIKATTQQCDHLDCKHSNFRKQRDHNRKFKASMDQQTMNVESYAEKGSLSGASIQRTVSEDIAISPVSSRRIIDPKTFERECEQEAEAEAAAVLATLASKAAAVRRQRFEEAMGNRACRRTIVAELEGDLGVGVEPIPMPVDLEKEERRDRVSDLGMPRKSMLVVGQGQQITMVKGRDAAVIVRVTSVRKGHVLNSSRVLDQKDLPLLAMSVARVEDAESSVNSVSHQGDEEIFGAVKSDESEEAMKEKRLRDTRKKKLRHRRNKLSDEREENITAAVDRIKLIGVASSE